MTLLSLLQALTRAGVAAVALDPAAGKVRWQGGAVDDELRADVAAHKQALLALADGAPLVATPTDLARIPPPDWRLVRCDHIGNPTRYGVHWFAAGPDGEHTDIYPYPDSAAFWAWRMVGSMTQHQAAAD